MRALAWVMISCALALAGTDHTVVVSGEVSDSQCAFNVHSSGNEGPSLRNVAKALAAFERTLLARDSRFDRYALGDKRALTLHEKNGLVIFIGKGRCARCHNGPNFADIKFQNIGAGGGEDPGAFFDYGHGERPRRLQDSKSAQRGVTPPLYARRQSFHA